MKTNFQLTLALLVAFGYAPLSAMDSSQAKRSQAKPRPTRLAPKPKRAQSSNNAGGAQMVAAAAVLAQIGAKGHEAVNGFPTGTALDALNRLKDVQGADAAVSTGAKGVDRAQLLHRLRGTPSHQNWPGDDDTDLGNALATFKESGAGEIADEIAAAHLQQITATDSVADVNGTFRTALRGLKNRARERGVDKTAQAALDQLDDLDNDVDGAPIGLKDKAVQLLAQVAAAHLEQLNNRAALQAGVSRGFFDRVQALERDAWQAGATATARAALDQLDGLTADVENAPTGLREKAQRIQQIMREATAQLYIRQLTSRDNEGTSDAFRTGLDALRTTARQEGVDAMSLAHLRQLTSADHQEGVSDDFRDGLAVVQQDVAQVHLDQLIFPDHVDGVSDGFRGAVAGLRTAARQEGATEARAEAARSARRGYVASFIGGGATVGLGVAAYQNGPGALLGWAWSAKEASSN